MSNESTKYFSFSEALSFLRAGKRVSRLGWNGKGMYLEVQYPIKGESKMTLPYIYMVIPGHKVVSPIEETSWTPANLVPWLASQTDLLSDDWDLIN